MVYKLLNASQVRLTKHLVRLSAQNLDNIYKYIFLYILNEKNVTLLACRPLQINMFLESLFHQPIVKQQNMFA